MNIFENGKRKKLEREIRKYRKAHKKEFLCKLNELDEYIERLKYYINHWSDFDPNFKPHCNLQYIKDQLEAAIMSRESISAMLEQENVDNPKYLGGIEVYDYESSLESDDCVIDRTLIHIEDIDIDNSKYEFSEKLKFL